MIYNFLVRFKHSRNTMPDIWLVVVCSWDNLDSVVQQAANLLPSGYDDNETSSLGYAS